MPSQCLLYRKYEDLRWDLTVNIESNSKTNAVALHKVKKLKRLTGRLHCYSMIHLSLLPPANEVWGKVKCLQVCVCPQGGAIPACIAGGIPACLAAGLHGGAIPACIAGGIPVCLAAGLPGGQGVLQAHTQGGSGGGIWSRPTPKGEIEGDLVQAHSQGGSWGGSGLGGACLGEVCLLQGVPGGDPPDGYCCGRYASYWNAFLFDTK